MRNIRKKLKYLLPVLLVLMFAGLILSRIYRPEPSNPEPEVQINASEAENHIGKAAKVCGKVASSEFLPQIKGKPTFLNLGRPYPNQFFTVVIWNDDRNRWRQSPKKLYAKQKICVIGVIETHKNIPQIIVKMPGQIELQ